VVLNLWECVISAAIEVPTMTAMAAAAMVELSAFVQLLAYLG